MPSWMSQKRRRGDAQRWRSQWRKGISIRNLTFVNHAVTVSPFPSGGYPASLHIGKCRNTDLLSTGTNACCSKRHPDDKGKVSRCGTSFPRTVGSLFVVKRDHYYSRDILIGARSRYNFRQVSIFETADVEKCARSSLSLSRTNIDVIFVCSRIPKCKTEIATVSISDSASAQFARSPGYFFILNWPVVRMHIQKIIIYQYQKKARSSVSRKLDGLLTDINHAV